MSSLIRIIAVLTVSVFVLGAVQAGERRTSSADAHFATATVTGVQPILRVVEVTVPREVCWNEQVRSTAHYKKRGYRSHTPTMLGGILGGVVGNQFGGGRGQTVMTVAGTLLGASVGRDAAYRRSARYESAANPSYSTERRCEIEEVMHEEERLDGYRVTYDYQGREYVTRTEVDPGRTIEIRVQVTPVEYH